MNIVLASASPRRRKLLEDLGLEFTVQTPEVDEDALNNLSPVVHALVLASRKASAVAKTFGDTPVLVIAADTVVTIEDRILGKPGNEDEARAMLRALRGREHRVITGVAVAQTQPVSQHVNSATTRVFFREFLDEELEAYVASHEPYDKAGAYGIQGLGGALVDRIEGDYFNVVGLPLGILIEMLGFYIDTRPLAARLPAINSRFT